MALTLGELLTQLSRLPHEAMGWVVVLAKDAQGNDYSPCAQVVRGEDVAETTWFGSFRFRWKWMRTDSTDGHGSSGG
jgi:hypothetical protein